MKNNYRIRLVQAFALACVLGGGLAASVAVGSAATDTSAATTTTSSSTSTSTTTTTPAPPANTALPSISGTVEDGHVLTAGKGSWSNSPTSYTYQWQRCDSTGGGCSGISGATGQKYTLASNDVGHRMRVVVTATNAGGSGAATSGATVVVAASGTAPAYTTMPSLAGNAQVGVTLKANRGVWTGTGPITYDYTWQRCDKSGANCSTFVTHSSTITSYTLNSGDVGHTFRIEVTAHNSYGIGYVYTKPTAVVVAATPPQNGTQSAKVIAVQNVSLPDRLVIDNVKFSPSPITSRTTPITARFHVSDSQGTSVQGALVYAIGLPYGWTYNSAEVATDSSGWATLTVRPTRNMPLRRSALVMFVRARKPGDSILAGVSTRRLVQDSIR
jgi:hypothetical protein